MSPVWCPCPFLSPRPWPFVFLCLGIAFYHAVSPKARIMDRVSNCPLRNYWRLPDKYHVKYPIRFREKEGRFCCITEIAAVCVWLLDARYAGEMGRKYLFNVCFRTNIYTISWQSKFYIYLCSRTLLVYHLVKWNIEYHVLSTIYLQLRNTV